MTSAPSIDDIRSSFKTHANYLDAVAMCARTPYRSGASPLGPQLPADLPALAQACAAAPTMGQNVAGGSTLDPEAVKRSLANAWGAELILGIGSNLGLEDELVRLMNNWGVVQAYYAGYHGFQALLLAQRKVRPESHQSTQSQFASQWTGRTLDLPPWSCAIGKDGFVNNGLSPAAIDVAIHNWASCDARSCWSLLAKALRTTRDDRIVERYAAKRKEKQRLIAKVWREKEAERMARGKTPRQEPRIPLPRLGAAEKVQAEEGVRHYTVFDYLYRLRIKTNYVDALMFTDGPVDAIDSLRVRANLIAITASTMLLHELHIGVLVGKATMMDWVDAWAARNDADNLTLGLRRDLLDAQL